jgi:hypothetical protein
MLATAYVWQVGTLASLIDVLFFKTMTLAGLGGV